jgi:putative RecB family exonuclease
MKTLQTSYSRLQLYESCPRFYRFRYVDRRPEPPSEQLAFGSVVHTAIRVLNQFLGGPGNGHDPDAARLAFDTAWQELQREGRTPLNLIDRDEAFQVVRRYARRRILQGFDHQFEVRKNITISEDGLEVTVRGVIDELRTELIDGQPTTIVRDFKTSWQVPSQARVDRDLQLTVYALLCAPDGAERVKVELDMVRHDRVLESWRTAEDIAEARKRILADARALLEETEWTPRPGAICSWCPHTDACPAVQQADAAPGVPLSAEQAKVKASELVALKRRLAELTEELKTWCSEHGPVALDGVQIGFFRRESYRYPLEPTRQILTDRGYDPDVVLRVDTTELKKLIRRDPELEKALAAVRIDASTTIFTTRTVEGGEAG